MYHNFSPDTSILEGQCEHIRRYYHPVSMHQVSAAIHSGVPLPKTSVAITVDDGFQDFLHGERVFRRFELPSTVFLMTDFLDGKTWPWWKQIEYATENSRVREPLTLPLADKQIQIRLGSPQERAQAASDLAESLKDLLNVERLAAMARVFEALEVDMPRQPPEKWRPLTWEQVRELSSSQVEFGAHTKSHPILSSVLDEEELTDEILGSKNRVAEQLGMPVRHFCYPNGRGVDIGRETLEITRRAGFETAVTTEPGMNNLRKGMDPFLLKRLAVGPDYPVYYFAEFLAGVRFS